MPKKQVGACKCCGGSDPTKANCICKDAPNTLIFETKNLIGAETPITINSLNWYGGTDKPAYVPAAIHTAFGPCYYSGIVSYPPPVGTTTRVDGFYIFQCNNSRLFSAIKYSDPPGFTVQGSQGSMFLGLNCTTMCGKNNWALASPNRSFWASRPYEFLDAWVYASGGSAACGGSGIGDASPESMALTTEDGVDLSDEEETQLETQ